jgi:hypothetical protein
MCWGPTRRQLSALRSSVPFGLTERQARFVATVMLHSGVFVGRQYAAFAGITHGQKVHDFIEKLLVRRFVTPIELGSTGRTRIFHVHHKAERFMPSDAAHNGGIRITVRSPRRWA